MGYFHYTYPSEHRGKMVEWRLSLTHGYGTPEFITCTGCKGNGKCWGLGCWDPDDPCGTCGGTGMIKNPEYIDEPKPPQWLVDQLSKVMRDAWNKAQNEQFELTPPKSSK